MDNEPSCCPIIWFGTPHIPFYEPFADGMRIGAPCPGTACEILELGDIDPCIDRFIVPESTALASDVECCSEGMADHWACRADGNLMLTFALAPSWSTLH